MERMEPEFCGEVTPSVTEVVDTLRPYRRNVSRVALAVGILNLLDALLTLIWITSGAAREGNPIMAALLDLSPVAFFCTKVGFGSFGVWFLETWSTRCSRCYATPGRCRVHDVALIGLYGILIVYAALMLQHARVLF